MRRVLPRVTRFFGEGSLKHYLDAEGRPLADVTLGGPGHPAFLMPAEDGARIRSRTDLVTQTGRAPGVVQAVASDGRIFGVQVPLEGLDVRTPTFNDAIDRSTGSINPNFVPGGTTAVESDGLFRGNPTREVAVDGGTPMPSGSVLFEWLDDGAKRFVSWL